MNPIDLSLYLVLDPDLCGGPEGMVRTARVAAENGVTVVQLRAPGWKKKQWLETARELKAVLAPLGVPLIINDQIDVALAVDADGVHIGQDDLPAVETRRLIGPDKILGVSVSDFTELAAVPVEGVDYIGIGPIFPTLTKLDAGAATGFEGTILAKTCQTVGASPVVTAEASTPSITKPLPGPISRPSTMAVAMAMAVVAM